MLVTRPDLIRVRLELGRAFFLKGEDSLARRHFEQVLAGKPPAPVALNVSRFLSIMRARKRWSLRVGMALAPDSNIGAASDERTVYILGLPFRRDQEDLTSSGVGVSVWAGGEYQYPLDRQWRLRAGGDVSRREYRSREFGRTTVAAHLGPRWLLGRGGEASLLAERAPTLAGGRAGPSRYRPARGVAPAPDAAHVRDAAGVVARPQVRRAGLPGRPGDRHHPLGHARAGPDGSASTRRRAGAARSRRRSATPAQPVLACGRG